MPPEPTVRNQVFVSYSHADEEYLKRLRVHLALLERRNIKIWTDKDIEPGMKWQDEITGALAKTKVAVLMISTDFLNSDFITRQELPPLLAAANSQGVEILPVIVKPSAFGDIEIEPLSCYQAVNMGRPLAKLKDDAEREEEFVRILQVIRKHMEGAPRQSAQQTARPAAAVALAASPHLQAPADGAPGNADEPMPLEMVLAEMMADPTAQALVVRAVAEDAAIELMLVTEGRDGTMLLEVLSNDELPEGIHLGREAQRHLVGQLGFNRPEVRGDRFWTVFGADGEEIDPAAITETIALVLRDIFEVPNEAVGVDWVVLEQ